MVTNSFGGRLLLTLGILGVLAGCASGSSEEGSEAAGPSLAYDGDTCEYEGPTLLEAGLNQFLVSNTSGRVADAAIGRLDPDIAVEDVEDYLMAPEPGDPPLGDEYFWTHLPSEPVEVEKQVTYNLGPGLWVIVCVDGFTKEMRLAEVVLTVAG